MEGGTDGMRWLGMLAAVCTLAAVILNSIWFARRGGMSAKGFLALSGPTVLYLMVFLAAVFAIAWLSGRLLLLLDPREAGDEGDGADDEGSRGDGGDNGHHRKDHRGEGEGG